MRIENALHVKSQIQISSPLRLNLFSGLDCHYSNFGSDCYIPSLHNTNLMYFAIFACP